MYVARDKDGDLMAFNKKLVAGYGDMTMHADGEYEVVLDNGCPAESMRIANEWADDTHVLGLTKKRHEIIFAGRR